MRPDSRKCLWDALRAAERIARFITGKSFDDDQRDDFLKSAIERQLEIIGEALSQLRRVDVEWADAISAVTRIIAFPNVRIHGYATVDDRLVWGLAEASLGHLIAKQRCLLSARSEPATLRPTLHPLTSAGITRSCWGV